jgi:hypothetical protein
MDAKTLHARERELQQLMASPAGRVELEALANRYEQEGGSRRQHKTSVITYIIVHERQQGLIVG